MSSELARFNPKKIISIGFSEERNYNRFLIKEVSLIYFGQLFFRKF